MEAYLGYLVIAFLGVLLAVLIRSLIKMYERLGNTNTNKAINPSEIYGTLVDAMNEAMKLRDDRQRKYVRKNKAAVEESTDEPEEVPMDEVEAKVKKLWEYYRDTTGDVE
mgnify:CR=1 FL=1|jgi:hypothetical protein